MTVVAPVPDTAPEPPAGVTSMAGFTTDHVLVRAAQADLAVAVLSGSEPPVQRPGTNP